MVEIEVGNGLCSYGPTWDDTGDTVLYCGAVNPAGAASRSTERNRIISLTESDYYDIEIVTEYIFSIIPISAQIILIPIMVFRLHE